jgi:glycosyltransferase involved in cell wall biosynthesis
VSSTPRANKSDDNPAGDEVLLNLLWLRPGLVGGTERYVTELLGALAPALGVRLVVRPEMLEHHGALVGRFAHEVREPRWGRPGRVWAERRRFAEAAVAVHHLGGTVAARSASPTAVTIYDLQVFDHPEFFHPLKRRYLLRMVPNAVERADLICVMSDYVADSLGRHLGVDRERCRVVPPAISAPPVPAETSEPAVASRPYVLFPAMTWPHKRHRFLVEVVEKLPDVDLVLTGGEGPAHAEVMSAVSSSAASSRIRHLRRVPAETLAQLYRGALVVAFPSAYEGFGQPVLEAMAHGCPVLTSEHAALPEAAGDAALVLADDVQLWVEAIETLQSDGAHRAELIGRGITRAASFTPAAAAAAQLAVYDELRALSR